VVLGLGAVAVLWIAARFASGLFYDEPHGALYVYSVESGDLEKISSRAAFQAAWAANSESVWFTDASIPGNGSHSVWEVHLSSKEARKIFDLRSGGYATLLPEAGLVAYARGATPPLTVHVAGIDGTRTTFADANYPAFDASGQELTFVRPSCARPPTVYEADPRDEASARPATPPEALAINHDGYYSISPNERFVVYWKKQYGDIFLRDLTTGSERNLGSGFADATWAPDSSQFLFMLRPNGFGESDSQILQFVRAADGEKLAHIDLSIIETHINLDDPDDHGQDQELVAEVAWSPDGASVAIGIGGGGQSYPPCGT
jgi:hypothetical protein